MNFSNLIRSVYANEIPLTTLNESGFSGLESITIGSLISGLITLVLILATLLFFAFLVIGGIQWITGKAEEGRKKIIAAIIGLLIVFAVWAILSLVGLFFGINLISFDLSDIATGVLNDGNPEDGDEDTTGICPCGGGATGLCAVPGNTGPLTYDPETGTGPCYLCTESGWTALGYSCEFIPNNSPDCRYPCN